MYLTRLTLDLRSRDARRDLSDAYEMHRSLARVFCEHPDRPPPRFLWRLEPPANSYANPVVLIQSETPADNLNALSAQANYLAEPVQTKAVELSDLVREDERYRFRLVANPTVTRAGKRYGLSGEDSQLAWLQRQGKKHGFGIHAAAVTGGDVLDNTNDKRRIVIKRVRFEGVLSAVDSARLSTAITHGIGPGKAFGCGLLSLAPC